MSQERKRIMVPCGFVVSRETGEILEVERCEMKDEEFRKIAAAVWGLKIDRRTKEWEICTGT